jgi:hypothetical protein
MGAWYTCEDCKTMMVRFPPGPPPEGPVLCTACRVALSPAVLARRRKAAAAEWDDPYDDPGDDPWEDR